MSKLTITKVYDALHRSNSALNQVYLIRDYNDIIDNFTFIISRNTWYYIDMENRSISKVHIDKSGKLRYDVNNGSRISTVLGDYKASTLAELRMQAPNKYMEIYQEFNETIFNGGNYFASHAVVPLNSGDYRTVPRYGDRQYIFIDNAIDWLAKDVL